jgi:hypothetical protein
VDAEQILLDYAGAATSADLGSGDLPKTEARVA